MVERGKPNPFQVLGLPTDAKKADIVARGRELVDFAETEEQRLLYREAIQQLITNPSTRLQHELFEVPDAHYENEDPVWDSFAKTYGRKPVDLKALVKDTAPANLEDFDLAALIRLFLDGLLTMPEADIMTAIDSSPLPPGYGPPPLEVRDVIFG